MSRHQSHKPRKHRAVKTRYTMEDWQKLVATGMAWEFYPGGPETFVGRVVRRNARKRGKSR